MNICHVGCRGNFAQFPRTVTMVLSLAWCHYWCKADTIDKSNAATRWFIIDFLSSAQLIFLAAYGLLISPYFRRIWILALWFSAFARRFYALFASPILVIFRVADVSAIFTALWCRLHQVLHISASRSLFAYIFNVGLTFSHFSRFNFLFDDDILDSLFCHKAFIYYISITYFAYVALMIWFLHEHFLYKLLSQTWEQLTTLTL